MDGGRVQTQPREERTARKTSACERCKKQLEKFHFPAVKRNVQTIFETVTLDIKSPFY